MDIVNSNIDNVGEKTDTGRRSFMWKIGAGMSAVLAAAVPAIAKPVLGGDKKLRTSVGTLSRQIGILENEKSIRKLHKLYEDRLDKGMYSEIPDMFTKDAEVVFNGGVFKGNRGVKRLFCDHFSSGMTGKRIDPAPGFELSPEQQEDMVQVSPDLKSIEARFSYSIQVGAPMKSDLALVRMARLHGEGIMKWWEGGLYEVSYVKNNEEKWRIKRLEYRTLSKADYRSGRSYAKPISISSFSKLYPEDQAGPDRLIS